MDQNVFSSCNLYGVNYKSTSPARVSWRSWI